MKEDSNYENNWDEDITIDFTELNGNILENLYKMHKFLKSHNLPELNCKDIENLDSPTTKKEIESVIKASG